MPVVDIDIASDHQSKRRRLINDAIYQPHRRPYLRSRKNSDRSLFNPFDSMPDDVVTCIFQRLASVATSPSDLISAALTCKRFHKVAMEGEVLRRASLGCVSVKVASWSGGAESFLRRCADSGNAEASYFLGMIQFYCLEGQRTAGEMSLVKAAAASHPGALHSLALIQFNGSGELDISDIQRGVGQGLVLRKDQTSPATDHRNPCAGVALCARAALLLANSRASNGTSLVDSLRELGHCYIDGYGLPKDPARGRRLLLAANLKEAREFMLTSSSASGSDRAPTQSGRKRRRGRQPASLAPVPAISFNQQNPTTNKTATPVELIISQVTMPEKPAAGQGKLIRLHLPFMHAEDGRAVQYRHYCRSLLSGFGCSFPTPWPANTVHPANTFLVDWSRHHSAAVANVRRCGYEHCGRSETRANEFRRCSACNGVCYCSRACQAMDWKLRHNRQCRRRAPAVHE